MTMTERAARSAVREGQRAVRSATRTARRARHRALVWTALCTAGRAARPVAPLMLVTGFAAIGQVLWSLDHVAPPDWAWPARLALALGAATAVESIALNVQWHAHDAQVNGRHTSAVRLRRASYGIAALVAGINYSHFAAPGLQPTPAAVMFALFSLSSPWLWGLHTRRVREIRLAESGAIVDVGGAVFLSNRWRIYPLRTFGAWRWSIDHCVTDPRSAWVGYHAARAQHRAERPRLFFRLLCALIVRVEGRRAAPTVNRPPAAPAPPAPSPVDDAAASPLRPIAPTKRVALATATAPAVKADTNRPVGRRARKTATRASGRTLTDAELLAAALAYAREHGPFPSAYALRTALGIGQPRAAAIFDQYESAPKDAES
jgi:hypothetical protein